MARVLYIVLLSSFTINAAQGSTFDDKNFNPCTASRVTDSACNTADVFCIGVKSGKVSFPEGTGCLKDNSCENGAFMNSVPNKEAASWKSSSTDVLVLSLAKASTTSKVGETYKLPPSVVALGLLEVQLTNKDGKVGDTNDGCFKIINEEISVTHIRHTRVAPLKVDCKFNGFKADLYKDKIYVTLVVKDEDHKLVAEHPLDSPIVLLGRGGSVDNNGGGSGGGKSDSKKSVGHSTSSKFIVVGLITAVAIVLNNYFY